MLNKENAIYTHVRAIFAHVIPVLILGITQMGIQRSEGRWMPKKGKVFLLFLKNHLMIFVAGRQFLESTIHAYFPGKLGFHSHYESRLIRH